MSNTPTIRRFSLFPTTLAKAVEDMLKPVCKELGISEYRILTQWHAIVGDPWGNASIPQKMVFPRGRKEGATLHLLTTSARALELQHTEPMILDKIATYFGYPAVAKIKIVQSYVPLGNTTPTRSTRSHAPLHENALAQFMPEGSADPEMEAALQALSREYLHRCK